MTKNADYFEATFQSFEIVIVIKSKASNNNFSIEKYQLIFI